MNFVAALLCACAGRGRDKVFAPDLQAGDVAVNPADANASIVWMSAGHVLRNTIFHITWLLFGDSSDYELFVTGTGDAPIGTGVLNTWQNMGAVDLEYALSQTSIGSKQFNGTYQIRLAVGHAVVDGGTLNLNAIVDSGA